jgi:hypothetical protein
VFNGEYVPGNICYSCGALTDVVIGPNVKNIYGNAFGYCSSLTNVSFVNTESISTFTGFQYCTSLESICLPEGLTRLNTYVFEGCSNLRSITLPSTLKWIEDRPFWERNDIDNVYISDLAAYCNLAYDNNYSFIECKHLYLNNELLTNVILPDAVTHIQPFTLNNDDITSVVIPDSVVRIDAKAFSSNLQTVYYTGSEENWKKIAGSDSITYVNIVYNYVG